MSPMPAVAGACGGAGGGLRAVGDAGRPGLRPRWSGPRWRVRSRPRRCTAVGTQLYGSIMSRTAPGSTAPTARALVESLRGEQPVSGLSVAVAGPGRAVVDAAAVGVADARTSRTLTPETLLHACSMSKLVAAVTVVRLWQDGALDLYADVDDMLGSSGWSMVRPPGERVTPAHLLSHQGGIVDPPDSFAPSDPGRVWDVAALLRGETAHHAGPVVATSSPGQSFAYSDAGFCVLEQVVRTVTGRPYSAVVDELVLEPLGLAHPEATAWATAEVGSPAVQRDRLVGDAAAVGHDADGRVVRHERPLYPGLAAAGLWATPTALATLLVDLLGSWHQSHGVLSAQSARALWTAPGAVGYAALGAFLLRHGAETVVQTHGWGEGFQGVARVHLDRRTVVVAMMNTDPGVDQDSSAVGAIADAVTQQV